MVSRFDADELRGQGVDSCQFDLVEETKRGSTYFQPMSQECLNTLDKRPDFEKISWDFESSIIGKTSFGRFSSGDGDRWPSENDAHWVRVAITDQLRRQKSVPNVVEDMWRAIDLTPWEEVVLVHLIKTALCALD